jgi:acetylornithine aminotransferase/acetylornithine/N-succinyldiaminopimelate aminotransferase
MDNSFHGRTFGALATTGQPKYRAPFVPLVPGVNFVKFNDVDDLKSRFDSGVCAVCIETIQGEGGICPVSREFLELASRLAKENGALLLLDEIQSGLGRTGKHFAYQHYGVLPDIVTIAKPLACGLPLGAILTSNRVAGCMHPGMHGTTFGGGPLACAVAIKFLKEEKKLLKHVRQAGEYFQAALQELDKKHGTIQDVRGVGLMLALELDSAELAKAVTRELLKKGIIINRTHETVLRFLPPYVIKKKHVDQVVKALDAALHKHAESTKSESAKPGSAQKGSANSASPRKEKVASQRRKAVDAHA